MSIQKLQNQKKDTCRHPWENIIKPILSHKIKYAHNSVNNVKYPKIKEKLVPEKRIQFTVIGNRVTKEFIYCSQIVRGLHKYHSKIFDAPHIRGVTTVEWPDVLHDLQLRYGGLTFCLESQVAVILNDKFLGGDKELKETIESKYRYHLDIDYYNEGVNNFVSYIKASGRPCAYMHIIIDEVHIGTLIFMLYSDIVPYTCENFLRLCVAKKGGYSGTPVHRIVKDSWIQCGGYGLKSTDLDCENYIVPHDRRGVLAMANDGRNVDCSTQFFVLLQPAPWMAQKYVAFGQLIDGEETLKTIEAVPTWYESPAYDITILRAGVLNLECHRIPINKGTTEYVQKHIEDLVALGEVLYEELMEKVFTNIEAKEKISEELPGEGEEVYEETRDAGERDNMNLRATQRFLHKKEDTDLGEKAKASSVVEEITWENNEFDVEVYDYEYEPEESYQHVSLRSDDLVVKPSRPFYLPFTDVPYPDDEVESVFDFKKYLKGDYCLESDLQTEPPRKIVVPTLSYVSERYFREISEQVSVESLNSDDEKELKKYFKMNAGRVSFAGDIIKHIGRGAVGKYNIFENTRKSELITDEELRRFRLASIDYRTKDQHEKKVSLSVPNVDKEPKKINRRPTGFVKAEDLEMIRMLHRLSSDDFSKNQPSDPEDDEAARKVRIAPSAIVSQMGAQTVRRLTAFELHSDSDLDVQTPSAFRHLYENSPHGNLPTLKDLKNRSNTSKAVLLTTSPDSRIKSENHTRDKYLRRSMAAEESFEQILNLQHGKGAAHKISSDYVKTIDMIEQKVENSIRSIEFAKTRPSMSVTEYQEKNRKYYEDTQKEELAKKLWVKSNTGDESEDSLRGIRLPGDTPLYSMTGIEEVGV